MSDLPTLFRALPHDTKEELGRRYRSQAAQLHPDKNSEPEAHAAFIKLTEEYEVALQQAPSSAQQERLIQMDKRRLALDEKRLTCHVRKKKGWSQNKNKKQEVPEPMLAIQDAKPLTQMEDEAGHICHGHQAGQGAKSADLGAVKRKPKNERHARWEQALLVRKEAEYLQRAKNEEKAEKSAEKQVEKTKTVARASQRRGRSDFGYDWQEYPAEIPEELRDLFVFERVRAAEMENDADEVEDDSWVACVASIFHWAASPLPSFPSWSCPCITRCGY